MCLLTSRPYRSWFDLRPDEVFMAETEVYGLISGPVWLRQSLVAGFENMVYVRNPYDKCIMTLPAQPVVTKGGGSATKGVVNEGAVLIEVAAMPEGGSPVHRTKIVAFYKRWQCGTCKNLRKEAKESTKISCIRVVQSQN